MDFLFLLWGILPIVLFFFYAYCQYILSKKLSVDNAWMAFVPIFNFVNLIKISGGKWYEFFILFIPIVNIYWAVRYLWNRISLRTGHGIWWTVGLILLTVVFLPLTAFSYKRPEITDNLLIQPTRNLKGLSIFWVICLIWLPILNVMLGMSLGWVQSKARDTARIANISMVSTMIEGYFYDNGKYPETPYDECISNIKWLATYSVRNSLPNDPQMHGAWKCSSGYAYKLIEKDNWKFIFVLATHVEKREKANFDWSDWENVTFDQVKNSRPWSVTSKNPKDWYYITTSLSNY